MYHENAKTAIYKRSGWYFNDGDTVPFQAAEDGTLRIKPIEEIERLRINPRVRRDISLADGAEVALEDISGDCLEIKQDGD